MLLSACLKRADMFNDQMQYLFSHVYDLSIVSLCFDPSFSYPNIP